MIVLDANVLVYAWNEGLPLHSKARKWVEELFSQEEWVGIPWVTIWAFLRLVTNPRVFPRPLGVEDAFKIVRSWLALPNVSIVQPGPRHEQLLLSQALGGQAMGSLLSDAVMAALTIEHGAKLATTDRDFARFPELAWFNPLDDNSK